MDDFFAPIHRTS